MNGTEANSVAFISCRRRRKTLQVTIDQTCRRRNTLDLGPPERLTGKDYNVCGYVERAAGKFAAPKLMAPLSVYTQLFCGIGLVLGLLIRWAGIILAINFIVAIFMVHWSQDFREWWPAIVLAGIGLQFALTGAGGLSIDAFIAHRANN